MLLSSGLGDTELHGHVRQEDLNHSFSQFPENLVRSLDNRLRNPGQLGHVDSVALVCGSGHYRPQEGYRSHQNLFLLR